MEEMIAVTEYEKELLAAVRNLTDTEKSNLLKQVQLRKQLGLVSGVDFLARTEHLQISDEDAREMMAAIEEAFEIIEDEPEIDLDG